MATVNIPGAASRVLTARELRAFEQTGVVVGIHGRPFEAYREGNAIQLLRPHHQEGHVFFNRVGRGFRVGSRAYTQAMLEAHGRGDVFV